MLINKKNTSPTCSGIKQAPTPPGTVLSSLLLSWLFQIKAVMVVITLKSQHLGGRVRKLILSEFKTSLGGMRPVFRTTKAIKK